MVHGDDDFLISRRQAFELAEQVEGARLLNLPYATHAVLKDSPEDVLAAFKAFVSSLPPKEQHELPEAAVVGFVAKRTPEIGGVRSFETGP